MKELSSRSVPLEHAPGVKPFVCIGLKERLKFYFFEKLLPKKITNIYTCVFKFLTIQPVIQWTFLLPVGGEPLKKITTPRQ